MWLWGRRVQTVYSWGGKKDVGIRGEKKVRQNSDINRFNLKVSKI